MRTMSKFKPTLSRAKVGMASLIFMESALCSAVLVTDLYYIGKSPTGPQPMDCLELGLVTINSICLFYRTYRKMPNMDYTICW